MSDRGTDGPRVKPLPRLVALAAASLLVGYIGGQWVNRGVLPATGPGLDKLEKGPGFNASDSGGSDTNDKPDHDRTSELEAPLAGPPPNRTTGADTTSNSFTANGGPSRGYNLKLDASEFVERPMLPRRACVTNGGGGEACYFRDALLCIGFRDVHKVAVVVPKEDPLWGELGLGGAVDPQTGPGSSEGPARAVHSDSAGDSAELDKKPQADLVAGISPTRSSHGQLDVEDSHPRAAGNDDALDGSVTVAQAPVDMRFNEQSPLFPRGFRIGLNNSLPDVVQRPQTHAQAAGGPGRLLGTDPRKRWPDATDLYPVLLTPDELVASTASNITFVHGYMYVVDYASSGLELEGDAATRAQGLADVHRAFLGLLALQLRNESGFIPPMDHVFVNTAQAKSVPAGVRFLANAVAHPNASLIFADDERLASRRAVCSTYGGGVVGTTRLATLGHLGSAVFRHRAYDATGRPQLQSREHPHCLLVVDRVGTPQAFTNWPALSSQLQAVPFRVNYLPRLPSDPAAVVEAYSKADVLLAAGPEELWGVVFMRPWSGVLQVLPYLWAPLDFVTLITTMRMNHFVVQALAPEDGRGPLFPNVDVEARCRSLNSAADVNASPECRSYVYPRGVTLDVATTVEYLLLTASHVPTYTSDDNEVM